MRVNYRKFFGKNFNSLGEFEIDVTPGRHLIIGNNLDAKSGNSNGTGKSSLPESIVWTQFKKSPRGLDPSRDQKGDCETGFEAEIGGNEYRIERYHKHKKFGNCSRIILNGEDISPRLTTGTDEEIQKLIPIPYDLFVSTCVVLQGLPINFSQFTPAVRKTIFEDALGFQVWTTIRKKFTDSITNLENTKEQAESRFRSCENEMTDLNARIESSLEDTSNRKTEIAAKAKDLKLEINTIKKKFDGLQAAHKDALNGKPRLELSGQLQELRGTLTTFTNKIADLKAIVEEEICPTCGTAYPESKMKDAQAELAKLEKKTPKIKENAGELEKTLEKADKIASDLKSEERLLSSKKTDLSRVLTEMAQNAEPENDKVAELRVKLESVVEQVNALNEEVRGYAKKLEGLEYIDQLLLPSSPFRTKVLEKYMVHVTGIIDQICPLIFPEIEVQLAINNKATGIDILITKNGRVVDYKTLSGGEKRRLDIVVILAFLRFQTEASGVSTNLVVLDEIFDALDARGVESVLSCIDAIFPSTHAVYVISHNTELKSQFDSIITVEKQNGISHLV